MGWLFKIKRAAVLVTCFPVTVAFAYNGPPSAAGGRWHLDVRPFVQLVDTNHDGCMSLKEWKAAGAPMSAYRSLSNADGCVTYEKMMNTQPPPGIDANGDGRLTLAEMIAYAKKMDKSKHRP